LNALENRMSRGMTGLKRIGQIARDADSSR
jgi:hypothetical protein